jgi:hypothetical protein
VPVERVVSPGHERKRSLGWLAAAWMDHFCVHGPGDVQGQPVRLSDELAAFTADVYALDASGRRLYDSAFFSRPKGADKSGHAARFSLFEALGACRFNGWAEGGEIYQHMDFKYRYERGEPMGRPVTAPFLRILATEEGQAGNVYDSVYLNLREGPLREAFARPDDIGLTRVYIPGGGEIRPSTASSSAKDGGKETFSNFDETHLYITPELRRMYATVRRNMAKRKAAEPWSFESSTMYQPGQNSIAEASHSLAKRIREGKVRMPRFLFDHREAPADTNLADEQSLRAGLIESYGSASEYMPLDRIIAEIWDPRNDVTESRRYFLNQVTAAGDAWVSPQEWDACADDKKKVEPKELIALGFDGSSTNDHTALVGCRISDSHLFTVGLWDPAQSGGEVPKPAVNAAVAKAFEMYDVVAFLSDVREWESYIDSWEQDYAEGLCVRSADKHPIAWDMRGRTIETTKAAEAFHTAVIERDLTHAGDKQASQYVYNARRWPNRYGVTFGKETPMSNDKVDWAAAAMLARKARQDYLALPDNKKRQPKRKASAFWA